MKNSPPTTYKGIEYRISPALQSQVGWGWGWEWEVPITKQWGWGSSWMETEQHVRAKIEIYLEKRRAENETP